MAILMGKVLTRTFFNRPVLKVAPELLGKFLVRNKGDREVAYKITEVEAYDGESDLANHASRGRTPRTSVMYGKPGVLYIYLIYGMYHMLNVVTDDVDYPSAILIRGVEGISGPGKLTRELHIDKKLHALAAIKKSGLWFEDRGVEILKKDVHKTPRIGVGYAGPVWSQKPYRFLLK